MLESINFIHPMRVVANTFSNVTLLEVCSYYMYTYVGPPTANERTTEGIDKSVFPVPVP